MNGKEALKRIKEYVFITLGIFLYCFSWIAFISSKDISGGGLPGVATIVQFATGIPISYTYFVINAILVITGTAVLGRGFGFKTIYSIIAATVMFRIMPECDWIVNFSDIGEIFLNAIIGGTIGGAGIALVFRQGGSTGGTDIVALILTKYREISPGKVFLYCDLIIIGSIYFFPDKGLQVVVYGYLQMVSFSYILDALLTGSKQSVQIMIISQHCDRIADSLVHEMQCGVTALHSRGWYLQKEGNVLLVVVRKYRLPEITAAVKQMDNQAFMSVCSAMNVYGNGFEEVRSRKSGKNKKGIKKWLKI